MSPSSSLCPKRRDDVWGMNGFLLFAWIVFFFLSFVSGRLRTAAAAAAAYFCQLGWQSRKADSLNALVDQKCAIKRERSSLRFSDAFCASHFGRNLTASLISQNAFNFFRGYSKKVTGMKKIRARSLAPRFPPFPGELIRRYIVWKWKKKGKDTSMFSVAINAPRIKALVQCFYKGIISSNLFEGGPRWRFW